MSASAEDVEDQLPEGRRVGRPTKFEAWMPRVAVVIGRLGGTQPDLAEAFSIDLRTVERWMAEGATFCRAVKVARGSLDDDVERSLYERAMGFEHDEEKIFCSEGDIVRADTRKKYAPDTVAAIFWLKNRRPERWRDRKEITGADGAPLNAPQMDADAVVDGLVALATEHRICAIPLRKLLQSALDRIPIPE